MKLLIAIVLLFGLIDCGCVTNTQPSRPVVPIPVVPIPKAEPIIEANNQFALDFYANLKDKKEGENIFFSPYSISTAMAMLYEGARNETAKEIQSVFHFPEDQSVRRSSFAVANSYLNRGGMPYDLNTANALWVEKSFSLQDAFKATLMEFYMGEAFAVDFKGAAEKERKRINQWVENNTMGKIKDLLPENSLSTYTRLVLTNAIYFKGKWEKPFEKRETKDEDFWLNESQKETVPMMSKTDSFNYAETERLQVLEMAYEGGDLSMLILLPKGKTQEDLKSLEESLTAENMNLYRESLENTEVEVFIPRFTFERGYNLKENLTEMGMPLAFDSQGQEQDNGFSGISKEQKLLYVEGVFHKAFVNVDEEGTVAAAATGVVMEKGLKLKSYPPVFKADHPFLFLIQERTTGYTLFMGKVANPVQ